MLLLIFTLPHILAMNVDITCAVVIDVNAAFVVTLVLKLFMLLSYKLTIHLFFLLLLKIATGDAVDDYFCCCH